MAKSVKSPKLNIVLCGCGKMGGALLEAWLKRNIVAHVLVIDPSPLPEKFQKDERVSYSGVPVKPDFAADVMVLAVKPQILKEAAEKIASVLDPDILILSIVAGQAIATLESLFGKGRGIVRTMPNTPAAIGKGITVAVAGPAVIVRHKDITCSLMGAAGVLEWVKDENLLNAVTALSGSGPAYVFLLIEILAGAGEKIGLSPETAMSLARQTIIGSAALAEASPDVPASVLRRNVTSPGGTTEAALEVLMNGQLQEIFGRALHAARDRARELSH